MPNPFGNIVPRKNEELVNKIFLKQVFEKIKINYASKKLIILEGGYGIGKTLYLWTISNNLKTSHEFIRMNPNLTSVLKQKRPVKNKTLLIDNLDLIEGLTEKKLFSLSEELLRLINGGEVIITALRKEMLRRLLRVNPLLRPSTYRIKIPGLNYEETKELILRRLNENRRNPSKSIKPFTEKELSEVWHKSQGNPRTILMICKYLYDQRMLIGLAD